MDPNANLEEQLRISSEILDCVDAGDDVDPYDTERLAELVEALNGWIEGGGFLPSRWK